MHENYTWGDINPDRLEIYDRNTSAYDPSILQWVTDQMSEGRPPEDIPSDEGPNAAIAFLMSEPPGEDNYDEWERRERLSLAVSLEMDRLSDEDAWIIYMLYHVRLSLRFVARVLNIPKTSMARRRDEILIRLRKALVDYPVVQEIVEGEPKAAVIPLGMPPISSVQDWEDGARWSMLALQSLQAKRPEPIASLLETARCQFPTLPTLGWWADLLGASILESRGSVDPDQLMTLLSDKQHDYGYKNILSFGHAGIVIRCSDKAARLENLRQRGDPMAEPLTDTFYDICGYSVIAGMLEWGLFMLPQRAR